MKRIKNFNFLSFQLSPELFEPASTAEKSQLVRMRESVTYWQDAKRRLLSNKIAMACAWILLAVLLFAWVGPFLMPYDYDQQIRGEERLSPTLEPFHPFGTDNLGRDLMVRVMIGTRISMSIGIVASVIILIIGTTYGAISGFLGGWLDNLMMRIVEIIYAVPDALIVILLGISLKDPLQKLLDSGGLRAFADVGAGLISIFLTFALLYWVSMARIVRGQVIALKGSEYVTAARAMGAKSGWIIFKHLVPNCVGTIIVTTMFQIPSAIFTESFLSFIGLGVSAPMASLGSLVNDALNGFQSYPYRLLIPAVMIAIIILALNQFGDGLRDALDPRMRC